MSTPTRRSSARLAGKGSSTSPASSTTSTPRKQKQASSKASASPAQSKKRKADDEQKEEDVEEREDTKKQKTLEETAPETRPEKDDNAAVTNGAQEETSNGASEDTTNGASGDATNGVAEEVTKEESTKKTEEAGASAQNTTSNGAVQESSKLEEAMPNNILEKGIIYFFSRARVNITDPKSVQDIARTYMVLRPLPHGAKLQPGLPIDDVGNNRLIALPKKVLPKSHRDVFMAFTEKAGVGVETMKEEFLQGSEYQTQTVGVSTSPPVTPLGEGVYAITTTGRESHLAYMLTIPQSPGEVQEQMGIRDKGSFIVSTKNPNQNAPANTSLPDPPEYPKEVLDEFRGRRWMPSLPKHLDYKNAQFLLIGEGSGELGKAVQAEEADANSDEKETPWEEMQRLEDEDLKRVEELKGDDSVFADLGIRKSEYPDVLTSW